MDTIDVILIIAILFLICLSAFFSATETAFSSVNKIRLKNLASNGNKKAARALKMSENYDELLSTILVGNNIANILSSSLATVLFTRLIGNSGVTIATIVMTVLVLLFGEISPKSIAKEKAESISMAMAPILKFFIIILWPINWIFKQWKKLLKKVFRLHPSGGITEEELITIVEEVESDGGLDKHGGELIRSAIEFNDLDVEDILMPRVDVIAVEENDSVEKVSGLFKEHGYSRLPVYKETIDHIIGIIHEKDFHAYVLNGNKTISDIVKPPIVVTEGTKISKLLRILQHSKTHMAIVLDEFGGTVGIATLEDILEELVGEIWDEHDDEQEDFKQQSDGSFLISCNANLDKMLELLEINEEYEVSTVNGWVMHELGKVPEEGDTFQIGQWTVTVTNVEYRRAIEMRVALQKTEQ